MMTSLTTILGLVPMALGFGEGSEIRTPMAITVIAGLISSTVLTLIIIPVIYNIVDFSGKTE
jgi:HAE1 family hydrophobic/amphiphilic exporter-1